MTVEKAKSKQTTAPEIQTSLDEINSSNDIDFATKERIRLINNLMVQIFLDQKDIATHNLLPFIRHLINKFNLNGYLCESDILIEAYTIAINKTKEGYSINNLPSWFKGTALNIIRNIRAELKKQEAIQKKIVYEASEKKICELPPSDDSNDDVSLILKAFNQLSEDDRYILNLRTVKGLTWSDIAETLISGGKEVKPEDQSKLLARLRQRHKRALNRLRKIHEYSTSNTPNIDQKK